ARSPNMPRMSGTCRSSRPAAADRGGSAAGMFLASTRYVIMGSRRRAAVNSRNKGRARAQSLAGAHHPQPVPYIDPLNYGQLELLKRYRNGDTDDRVVQGSHLTINAIAAGLRNSS